MSERTDAKRLAAAEQRAIAEKRWQLRRNFRNAIRADSRLSINVPDTLLHYTNLPAFYSILESRSFRSSRCELSNDTAEMTLANLVVREVLSQTEPRRLLSDELVKSIRDAIKNEAVATLVTCFTEPRDCLGKADRLPADILSMWRGYGDNGQGIAIHIDGPALASLATTAQGMALGTRLLKVVYDTDEQHALIENVIKLAHEHIMQQLPDRSDYWMRWATRAIATELSAFSAMFKHEGFAEEREWRLVTNIDRMDIGGISFSSHPTVKRACVHLVTRVSTNHRQGFFAKEESVDEAFTDTIDEVWDSEIIDQLPIVGVTVGPSNNQRSTAISVMDWALHHDIEENEFKLWESKIPFRN